MNKIAYDLYDLTMALNAKGWSFKLHPGWASDTETTQKLIATPAVLVLKREYGCFVLHAKTNIAFSEQTLRRFPVASKTLEQITAEIWATLVLLTTTETS